MTLLVNSALIYGPLCEWAEVFYNHKERLLP